MSQPFYDQSARAVGVVSGPWWSNSATIDAQKEQSPQEVFFQIEFSRAEDVRFHLAAGDFYQFWLNGQWVGCGPARASHGRLTVDQWDLPQGNIVEANTLSVQVFWEGVFTFDHVRGTPGLWVGLVGAEGELAFDLLITEKTGRLASQRFSHQRGWIEEIDGRQRPAGWPLGKLNASDWKRPVLRENDPPVFLEARDIKPFTKDVTRAERITFAGSGDRSKRARHRGLYYETNPGFEGAETTPSCVMQEEALEPAEAHDVNLSALTRAGEGIAIMGPDRRGFDRTLQLDFGKLVTGTLNLVLEAPAGTIVDFGWSEGRWNEADMGLWARTGQPGGSAPSQELNDARQGMRYICAGGGIENFHSLFLVSCHHLRIAFRTPEPTASISLRELTVVFRGYPISEEGSFHCSDEALNRIYAAAIHTMSCSIDDVYLDCPGRERGGYTNDSYWTSMGFLDTTGDVAFDRRFLRQYFDSQDVLNGATAACYPSDSSRWTGGARTTQYVITGHVLFWLLQCERHLRLFGDADLKEKWRPGLTRALAACSKFRSSEGLLENVPWDTYFDWSKIEIGHIQTGDNFLYARVLKQLGHLYGDKQWLAQGAETAEAIEKLAWRPDRELFADIVIRGDGGLQPSSSVSAAMNYVALWTGLVDPARARRAWRQLRPFRPLAADRGPFDYETAFVRANLVALMYRFDYEGRIGELTDLIRDLREAYEPMFARGQATLSEHLGYHGSLCHAYNGFVVHLLNRYIAGIEMPEEPDGIVRVRPHPEILAWCQARVCCRDGHVQAWWSRNGDSVEVMVSLPAGRKGELILGDATAIAFTGSLHTTITF